MLIEFNVGNYLSFKDIVNFSMIATPIREHKDTHVFQTSQDLKLLKSAVVYGANASGKSNLFKAIAFMSNFVQNSSKDSQAEEKINVEHFRLSTETEKKPSYFEVSFIQNQTRYRYGFEVTTSRVMNEWLFYAPKKQEVLLFTRNQDSFEISNHFSEGRELDKKTRPNALFLSVVAQFNGEKSIDILKWFKKVNNISGLDDSYKNTVTNWLERKIFTDSTQKENFLELMKIADVGIEDIRINKREIDLELLPQDVKKLFLSYKEKYGDQVKMSSITTIRTLRKKYDSNNNVTAFEEFEMDKQESHGTQKLFSLLGPILDALHNGKILIIDEFDSRLHTLLTRFIIKFFNSEQRNPLNTQLIFSTHDTNLLGKDIFRRDQIWFTEKNRYGATDLYSLVEYKVRNDASYEKDYLLGKYGAIPFIGEFKFFPKGGNP